MKAYKIMRAFKVQIVLGDEAMQSPDDVAEALRSVADKLADDIGVLGPASPSTRKRGAMEELDDRPLLWPQGLAGQPQAIKDRNGNTVGQWEVR